MSPLPIAAKLLRASQQTYDIKTSGPVALRPPFDQIGWLAPPQAFAAGLYEIEAALVGETATETIVAFRGTLPAAPAKPDRQVVTDWLGDLAAVLVQDPHLPGHVHQGFAAALNVLWPKLQPKLGGAKPLYFTGHSKGGAVANLAAARFVAAYPKAPAPAVVTFGAAKPGDAAFRDAYDKAVPRSQRWENGADIVPHLPPGVEFRAMFLNLSLFAQALAHVVSGYVGVGELKYIETGGAVVANTPPLRFRRYAALAELIFAARLRPMIEDHALGDDGGYGAAVLPAALGREMAQAAPGASAVA